MSTIQRAAPRPPVRVSATVIDGSLSGLAHYHLLRQELDHIRALPERRDRDRDPGLRPS